MKAIDQMERIDRRRLRAYGLVSHITHIVSKYISDEDRRHNAMRDLSRELTETLWEKGVEIITDEDRRIAGISPRGPDGWTLEEIAILEQRRLEIMLAPTPPVILAVK